jgi:hypothetical protein
LDETASGNEEVLLTRRLNEAVREFLLRTKLYVVTDTVALVANDNEYDLATELDPDPLSVIAIVNSDNYPLARESVGTVLDLRRGTAPTAAANYLYRYAVSGAHTLMLYPTPNATGTLTVHYVPKPTALSAGGDDPSGATLGNIPVEFHSALEFYALWRMAMYDDDSSSQMGQQYQALFEQACARARRHVYLRGGVHAPRARVGRRAYVSSDPSRT